MTKTSALSSRLDHCFYSSEKVIHMKHRRNEVNLDSTEYKDFEYKTVVNEIVNIIRCEDTDCLANYLSDLFDLSEDNTESQAEETMNKANIAILRVKEKVLDSFDTVYELVFTVPYDCEKKMQRWIVRGLPFQLFSKNRLLDQEEGYCLFLGVKRYDILHFYETASVYYEITTKDIIRMLEIWNRRYGIRINGCGKDWLAVDLLHLYYPIENLLYQISELCPQLVLKKDQLVALKTIGGLDYSTIHMQWK